MKLSSHEEYGLRCLLQVARQGADGSATIREISREEGISTPYVAKLMRILRQGGLVKAARGKVGGYTLALPPEQIWVADALTVLGGQVYGDDFCERHSGTQISCAHSTGCSIRSLWRNLQGAIDGVLRTTTIQDLLHSGHDTVTATALPRDLVPLHGRAAPGPTKPISK